MGYSWLFDRENDDEQMDGIGFCHLQTQPFEGFMNCGFWFWFWAVDDLFAAITYIYIYKSLRKLADQFQRGSGHDLTEDKITASSPLKDLKVAEG